MADFKAANGDALNCLSVRTLLKCLFSVCSNLACPPCFWGFGLFASFFLAAMKACGVFASTKLRVSAGRLRSKSSILGFRFSLLFLFLLLEADLEMPPERLNDTFDKIFSLKSCDLFFNFSFLEVCSNLSKGFSWCSSLSACSCLNSAILLAIEALFADLDLSPVFFFIDWC